MTERLTVGSLFAGIGGFELGLERAGMDVAWHCESDPFCQRVLEKHWPGVPIFDDVCTLNAGMAEGVDVLCGGFPCQDISSAGKKVGIHGARSGLWSEYARLIGEFRPRYVIVENVSALLSRGLGVVLADLSALGYDAEWDCIPASAIGAPHQRDRVWIVGYPYSGGEPTSTVDDEASWLSGMGNAYGSSADSLAKARRSWGTASESGWWAVEPNVGRVAHGVPARVDRLRSLGNALVPQIAEWLGQRIVVYEALR